MSPINLVGAIAEKVNSAPKAFTRQPELFFFISISQDQEQETLQKANHLILFTPAISFSTAIITLATPTAS